MKHYFIIFIAIFLLVSCSNDEQQIDDLLSLNLSTDVEVGKNIRILYSDSAIVKIIINAPVLERHLSIDGNKDIFPKGILLEFLDENQKITSWLKADYAIREDSKSTVTAKGNVIVYNEKNEKLETPELIWDEKERYVHTDKIVRITQAEKGDTTIGFGFKANQNFTRFEILKKVQGKVNVSEIVTPFN